jgi:hypothetical protein
MRSAQLGYLSIDCRLVLKYMIQIDGSFEQLRIFGSYKTAETLLLN